MDEVQPGAAYFDPELQAWILSSHDDVSAGLRETRLAAVDSPEGTSAHRAVRDAVKHSLPADRLADLRAELERTARDLAMGLPADRLVDLVASFAGPWSLGLAANVTGVSAAEAAELAPVAREIFRAAAFATDSDAQPATHAAAAELARRLPAATATINVQTFVALSQTLPHTLAGAWLALFGDPAAVECLRTEPDLMPKAVDELLRIAGPSRAVFRGALDDVRIGGAGISRGDRVVLMLAAANHDPARYPEPDRLDIHRGTGHHVAFGGGVHPCSGARLIRVAAAAATDALLRTTNAIVLSGKVEWVSGFAVRAPASLPAVLRRHPGEVAPHRVPTA